jgi:Zeta toxin
MAPVAAVDSLETLLEETANDPTVDPAERVSKLRALRADIATLVGTADRYIGDQELEREGRAFGRVRGFMEARAEANARGELLDVGAASPEGLDAAGVLSHQELDRRAEDGTIEEAVVGLSRKAFDAAKHPRGRGGEWSSKGGVSELKGRGGGRERELDGRLADAVAHAEDAAPEPRAPKAGPVRSEPSSKPGRPPKLPLDEIERLGLNAWPEKGEVAQQVLGNAKDTQELHSAGAASPGTGGAVYSASRKPVHDRVVGEALSIPSAQLLGEQHPITTKLAGGGTLSDEEKATLKDAAEKARGGGKPVALFMGGGSASGKSSALAQAPDLVPDAAVHIDPDAFKEKLPEYQQMREGGERYAAAGAHEESADLAKRAQDEARQLGLNMLIDGTGDSGAAKRDEQGNITEPGKFAKKLIAANDAGYDVKSLYVTVPTDVAVQRSVARAGETGRFVPVPEVRNQHRNVSANFPEISALPFVSKMQVFDTSGGKPALIATGGGGQVSVHDEALHQAFLDKAHEGEATGG